jgi:alkanesulfonate monooxygenase SsuD/methylene tetrahydromethanopterin reductase-like flavin-dependent oxidoreductase (luciferase family)
VPSSPQGRPLLVQAGSSPDGREFAARYAEAIFTAQQTLADGQEFYADMKRRARLAGRDPELVKIMPESSRSSARRRPRPWPWMPSWTS